MKKLLVLLLLLPMLLLAQTKEEINNASGLQKAQLELQYAASNVTKDPSYCIEILKDAVQIGKDNNQPALLSPAYMLLSKAYYENGQYEESLSAGKESEKLMSTSDKNYPTLIHLMGSAAKKSGATSDATTYLEKSYSLEPKPDKALEIASLYGNQKKYKQSIEWYEKGIKDITAAKPKIDAMISLALVTANYGDNEKAQQILDDAYIYGDASQQQQIENYKKDIQSNQVAQESNTTAYQNDQVTEQGLNEEDLQAKINALNAKSLDEIETLSEAMQLIELKIKAQADDYEKQLLEQKLLTTEANKKLQLEKAENEKIAAENMLISAKKQAAEKELANTRLTITLLLVAVIALIGFALLFFILFRNKKRAATIEREQREKIEKQSKKIEKQHSDIKQSLDYAMQIQQAVLPSKERFLNDFQNSFVFHKPRDFVSGDFFWYHMINKDEYVIATADCTGHGVPGAFMTILCSTILEKIVVEEEVTSPDLILEQTSERLTKKIQDNHLDGDEEDFKGGMDVAIVHINMKTKEIKFSGARNPLYVVRHSELIEIKPTRRSVAYKTARKMPDFAVETFQLMDNDHLYMFSDGFADQKGGPKGKKYYYKPFKEFLAKLPANNPIDYQHDILEAEFNRWRGDIEQYDDVIIVGLEIEETV